MKAIASLFALVLLIAAIGCGSGPSSSSGSPTPSPTPATSTLVASPGTLNFSSTAGGSNPATQTLNITSTGSALTWTASTTTADGGTWLTVSPTSGTTPATVTVTTNVAGLGAATFNGSATFTASSSTATGNVNLQLAPPQPPYFTGTQSFLLTPQAPVTITMPDGSQLPDGSNQLLVFLALNATTANMQSVASVLGAHKATVVGEVPSVNELQVQMQDPSLAADLILQLQATPGVISAQPNLFSSATQSSANCTGTPLGTGWLAADNPSPAPPNAGSVVIAVVDEFAPPAVPGQPAPAPQHGDDVLAYVQDSSGKDSSGNPIFQVNKSLFKLPLAPQDSLLKLTQVIGDFVASQPVNVNIVVNVSRNPAVCKGNPSGTVARAACWVEQMLWYAGMKQLTDQLTQKYGDRVLLFQGAANTSVGVPSFAATSSCHMVVVGGLDQVGSNASLASFSTSGGAVNLYAPACNVSPLSLTIPPNTGASSGNSFATPQAAGFGAAEWAQPSNSGLTACQLGAQFAALPQQGPGKIAVLDGVQLHTLAQAAKNNPAAPPSTPVLGAAPCGQINVQPSTLSLATGASGALTVTTPGITGATPNFLSSNPLVATVSSSGVVSAIGPGAATVIVSVPVAACSSTASVIVNGETYAGTASLQVSDTFSNTAGWIPDPITITSVDNSIPLQVAVSPSLLTQGNFSAAVTMGNSVLATTIPTETCTACNPPITVPGTTFNDNVPGESFVIAGASTGSSISVLVPGFPPLTGTLHANGSTTTLNLSWGFTQNLGGIVISVSLTGTLTKQ